jgi:ankyrin repeat protein
VASELKSLDIFGWSPLHYIALLKDNKIFQTLRDQFLKFHQTPDGFDRTPVHVLVAAGRDETLKETLEDLEDEDKENVLNAAGLDQTTPLHLATKYGLYDCVEIILDKDRAYSLTQVDLWGREAIHLAASHGHHDIASRLLREGAQPYSMDKIGMSPMGYLTKGDVDLKGAQLSDNSGGIQVDRVEDDIFMLEGRDRIVRSKASHSLVDRKRDIFVDFALNKVDYHDRSGQTFLHHAIQSTDTGTVQKLMNRGYKVDQPDLQGRSALHLAIDAGREDLAVLMLKNSSTFSVDLSAVDKQGETALMFAARKGSLDLVKRLISGVYRGDPDTKPSQSEANDQDLPHDIQNKDCDPHTRNSEGRTALQIAISEGHHEIVRYLLMLPKLQDEPQTFLGESLLVTACKRELPTDCVNTILQAWPQTINDSDPEYHQTPLSWACEEGNEVVVRLLLDVKEPKVDVNKQAKGCSNYSPLHVAAWKKRGKVAQMLLDHTDTKIDLTDDDGNTAFDIAIRSCDAPVAQAFILHHRVDAQARLEHMKQIVGKSDEALHEIIENIFVSLPDGAIHDSDLLELVELTENLRCTAPYLAMVQRALTRESIWKGVKPKPLHAAARLGDLDLMKTLCEKGAKLTDLDEDGWTCLEYADTYRSESLNPEVRKLILRENPGNHRSKDQTMPKSLDLTESQKQCTKVGDTQYPGIFGKLIST